MVFASRARRWGRHLGKKKRPESRGTALQPPALADVDRSLLADRDRRRRAYSSQTGADHDGRRRRNGGLPRAPHRQRVEAAPRGRGRGSPGGGGGGGGRRR